MPKHDHHEPRGPELAKVAQATFEHSGEQWTPMRARVFDVLSGFEKPASAYDIAEVVSKQEGRRIAANTIYRILDLFVIANLSRKVESANAYVANAHPDCRHDCIFLVCDSCGETIHLDDDRIGKSVRATAEATGFLPSRPVIEVRGSCVDCIHKAAISTLTR